MVRKITNSTKKKQQEAKRRWFEYRHIGSWKMQPYCEETIQKLAKEYIEWARDDEDALVVDEFYLMRGIGTSTFIKWKQKYPFFMEAHNMAKYLIGLRREKGTIKGKYSDTAVNRTQPAYSPRLKESEEWRSSLKQKEAERGSGKVVVEMQQFDNSPEVPPRPEGTD